MVYNVVSFTTEFIIACRSFFVKREFQIFLKKGFAQQNAKIRPEEETFSGRK